MRCFIAVDIEQKLLPRILEVQKELADLDIKLVEAQNLHFTVKFLGEVDEVTVNKVKRTMSKLVMKQFDISMEKVGVFPSEKFIRVVWLGAEDLTPLCIEVNNILADLFREEKPSPHLTLARVRSQRFRKEIASFISRHKDDKIGVMSVNEIKLKKSTVTSKGPVYEDIAVFKLMNDER